MYTRFLAVILVVVVFIPFTGCRNRQILPPIVDRFGCIEPSVKAYSLADMSIGEGKAVLEQLIMGQLDEKTSESIMAHAGKLSEIEEVRRYVHCLSRKADDLDTRNIIYLKNLSNFLSTNPSADRFQQWQTNYGRHSAMPDLVKADASGMKDPSKTAISTTLKTGEEKTTFLKRHYSIKITEAAASLLKPDGYIVVECAFRPTQGHIKSIPLRLIAVVHTTEDYIVKCNKRVNFDTKENLQVVRLEGRECYFVGPDGKFGQTVKVLVMLDVDHDFEEFALAAKKTPHLLNKAEFSRFSFVLTGEVPLKYE